MSMRKSFVFTLVAALVVLLSVAEQPVFAGSSSCNASGCTTTPGVDLNIEVNIPSMLRLQIGNAAGTDTITFNPSAATLADGTPVTATPGSGDLGDGRVSVRILSNGASNVTVNATTTPLACVPDPLTTCQGTNTINWDQITVAQGTNSSGFGCSKAPPQLVGGVGSQSYGTGSPGSVIDEDCGWIYSYANSVGSIPIDGTYQGTVTYTATATP